MQSIREFLETVGVIGLVASIGMTVLCLTAASLAYDEGNHQTAILWCLVLALLSVMAYLLWCIHRMIDIGDRAEAYGRHIGWDVGYVRGVMDELCGLERADNPFENPYVLDYERRGED